VPLPAQSRHGRQQCPIRLGAEAAKGKMCIDGDRELPTIA
jgi:hypothetical protein